MAILKDIGRKAAAKTVSTIKSGLGVSPEVTGFGNVMRQATSAATIFGSESKLGKRSSDEARAGARQMEIAKGMRSGPVEKALTDVDNNTDKVEDLLQGVRDDIKKSNTEGKTSGGQPVARTADQVKSELAKSDGITSAQGDKIIAVLEDIARKEFGGGGGGLLSTAGNVAGTVATGVAGIGALGLAKKLIPGRKPPTTPKTTPKTAPKTPPKTPPKTQAKLPKGTRLNSAGRLIDSKTGKFVKNPVQKNIQKNVAKKVGKKMALKVGAKMAVRAGLAATGVGAIATAGLLAFDLGQAAFSPGTRKEYTLANPAASEEEKEEAVQWLIENDPERVGIPEDIPPEKRMAFLEAQDANPELTGEQFMGASEAGMGEAEGESGDGLDPSLDSTLRNGSARIFGPHAAKKNGEQTQAELQRELDNMDASLMDNASETGALPGQLAGPQIGTLASSIEDATDRATPQGASGAPTIINNGGGGQQASQKSPTIIVSLPKTILATNPSAQRFTARTLNQDF